MIKPAITNTDRYILLGIALAAIVAIIIGAFGIPLFSSIGSILAYSGLLYVFVLIFFATRQTNELIVNLTNNIVSVTPTTKEDETP
jgi:4-amino-4-deoxy-L-arabinose transferase-like glycosyltransferase